METFFKTPDVLSGPESERIILNAKKLVCDIGLFCDGTEEFNSLLTDFGCKVDGGKVKFPVVVVEKVFAKIEEEAQVAANVAGEVEKRPRVADFPILDYRGDDIPIGYGVSGQAGLICDLEGKIRPCQSDDLARFSRMVDTFEKVEWHHPCLIPQDAPVRTREIHAYAIIAMNNSKPRLVSAYSKEAIRYFFEISAVCYGSPEKAREEAPFIHSLWINSPFTIGKEVLEGAMEARRVLGKPLKIVTMPVAGASTPVTLAGCLVQGTAEVIIENIITLAVDKRLNGYFSGPLIMDVRRALSTTNGPEADLLKLACVNIARRMFRNDRYVFQSFSLGTASKTPDVQSMMEKAQSGVFALLCGARIIGGMSTLASADVISPVQFLLDLELVNYLERICRGIEVNENTLAVDVIRRVAPEGANFLVDEHTFDNYAAEQWLPMFMDRRIAMSWVNDPKGMLDNAAEKSRKLWETAPNKSPLTEAQQKEIMRILAAADREMV